MPEMMKAALYLGPGEMEVREVPKPETGSGDVLLRVEACSLCGTDVRILKHGHAKIQPPHITGHEICGTLTEVGGRVAGLSEGQRAVIVTEVGCMNCDFCRQGKQNLCSAVSQDLNCIGYRYPGGFAEYIRMPEEAVRQGCVIPIPESLSNEEAALAEPLSCVINGQSYLNIGIGDTVAIMGAGTIGCMQLALARAQGASKVFLIGRSKDRLKLAERFKPDALLSTLDGDPVEQVMDLTNGKGASVAIVACSEGVAQEQALAMTAIQGRISLFGGLPKDKPTINFNSNTVHYKEQSVFGAFASNSYQYVQALDLLASGQVNGKAMITHHYSLDDVVEGIQTSMRGEALKVVIHPHEGEWRNGAAAK
jgi:L-iditol 2-dehydrogenase